MVILRCRMTMVKKQTSKATAANKIAAINHAKEVFKFLDDNEDLVKEDPSNNGIARTLNNFGIKTRYGNEYSGRTVKKLVSYRCYHRVDTRNSNSLRKFF